MEYLRLDQTVNCPRCSFTIKPFIVARKYHEILKVHYLELKCPLQSCGHTFNHLPDDPPVDA
jgi:hypothetical protein